RPLRLGVVGHHHSCALCQKGEAYGTAEAAGAARDHHDLLFKSSRHSVLHFALSFFGEARPEYAAYIPGSSTRCSSMAGVRWRAIASSARANLIANPPEFPQCKLTSPSANTASTSPFLAGRTMHSSNPAP